MKSTFKIGDSASLTGTVGPGQTITLGGEPGATVFSTPSMINLMEHAAREVLRPHLDPVEESVGIDVQVEHLAATPPGTKVTATATATSIEKNVVSFDLQARDQWELIGRGTHRRAVIRTQKFADQLADKKPLATAANKSNTLPSLQSITLRREDRVLWATLNRPAKRNAINEAMTSDLETLAGWLGNSLDQISVVIFSGEGNTFSAGDDVSELRPEDATAMSSLSLRRGTLYRQMTGLPQILIAAIDGLALGGGFVFASACDYRIATHNAKLGLPEVKLGWPPNYGLEVVQSVVGRSAALRLAVSAEPIGASEAHRLGVVDEVVPVFRLREEARQIAGQVAALSPDAVAAAKQLLSVGGDRSDAAATERFLQCLQTPSARAAISKFSKS